MEPFADPPFVGRRADLERLSALLERPPALGVVRGVPGSGRTALLLALRRVALGREWRVPELPPLGPETDRAAFVHTLRESVGLPETLVQAASQPQGERLLGREVDQTAGIFVESHAGRTLLEGLGLRPTLLLLDSYRAAAGVQDWLLDELLVELRGNGVPVVLILAGREGHVREAVARADAVVDTRLPTEAEILQYFSELGALLDPPAEAAELEVIAAEAATRPHLIRPLVRALSFARADE